MTRFFTAERLPVIGAFVALCIGVYQLSLPHVLTGVLGYNEGYDDGVYVGAAVRLVHGALPYRDFVLVHPPGIVLLLSPIALIGSATTSHVALILARLLTVAVTGLNPLLVGRLVRPAGRLVTVVASVSLALWPLTVSVDRGVELEPFLICLVLFGGLAAFAGGRVLTGGVVLGLACTVKVWGVVPALAAVIVFVPDWKKVGRLFVGTILGAAVPCAAFLTAAPGPFVHDIISAQAGRNFGGGTSMADRLELITGTPGLAILHTDPLTAIGEWSAGGAAEILAVAAVVLLAGSVTWSFGVRWRERSRLEWWLLTSAVGAVVMMLAAPNMADHYAYFPAAFLAPVMAVGLGGLRALGRGRIPRPSLLWGRRVLAAAAVTVVGVLVLEDSSYAGRYLSEAGTPPNIAAFVPAGACAVSDFPSDLLATDRFTSRSPGCPLLVDPLGTFLVYDHGQGPNPTGPYPIDFAYMWFTWLQQAGYLDLRIPYSDFIAWDQSMVNWFPSHYRLVAHLHDSYDPGFVDTVKDEYIYRREH